MSLSINNKEKIQKYLDELSKEYKELLFKTLLERSKTIDDMSVSELLRLDAEIKKPLMEENKKQKKIRKLLNLIGIVYFYIAVIMIILYLIVYSNIFDSPEGLILLISIVMGTSGAFISIYSRFITISKKRTSNYKYYTKEENIKILSFEVISKWRELEGVVNDLSAENHLSSHSIIEFLVLNKFINEEEKEIIRNLLRIRNSIVHETVLNYSFNEIEVILNKTDEVIKKLHKIL